VTLNKLQHAVQGSIDCLIALRDSLRDTRDVERAAARSPSPRR